MREQTKLWAGSKAFGACTIALIAICCAVALATFIHKLKPKEIIPLVSVPVNHEFSLKLMALRTKSDPLLEIVPLQHRLLRSTAVNWIEDKLPISVQTKLQSYRRKHKPEQYGTVLGHDEVELIFFVDWPARNADNGWAPRDVINEVDQALRLHKMNNIGFKRGHDALSDTAYLDSIFNGSTSGWVKTDRLVLGTTLRRVSPIAKDVDLCFFDRSKSGFPVINRHRIANPLYEENPPLSHPLQLPATISHNGLNVKLHALVSHSANAWQDEEVEKRNTQLRPESKYVRAAGTVDDPFCTGFVVQIWEEGKRTEWGLHFPKILIGEKRLQFASTGYNDPTYGRDKRGWLHWYTVEKDISWLEQPILISITPRRIRNLPSDEFQTLEITLPTSGTAMNTPAIAQFWDREVEVKLSNFAVFTWQSNWPKDQEKYLGINLKGYELHRRPENVMLSRNDGTTQSIEQHMASTAAVPQHGSKTLLYDLADISPYGSGEAINMNGWTTLSLTLTSPRFFHKSFDFIAEPIEATVPRH